MKYSRIIGTGGFLPEKILTNKDLERMVDTSDEWITDRTGIKKRHIAAEKETTCDLGEHAARAAIQAAGVQVSDIDLIIVATTGGVCGREGCDAAAVGHPWLCGF